MELTEYSVWSVSPNLEDTWQILFGVTFGHGPPQHTFTCTQSHSYIRGLSPNIASLCDYGVTHTHTHTHAHTHTNTNTHTDTHGCARKLTAQSE